MRGGKEHPDGQHLHNCLWILNNAQQKLEYSVFVFNHWAPHFLKFKFVPLSQFLLPKATGLNRYSVKPIV